MSNTFDAGSIESRLILDRSDFTDGLREAKAEGENFARQKFEATLGLDARGVVSTIASVRTELASLRNVNLNIGVSGSNAQIRAISQSASALDGRRIGMSVDISGIADASARLRTLRQQVNALDGRRINITVDVDTAGALADIAAVRAALNGLNGTTNTVTNSSGAMSRMFKKHMLDIVAAAMLAAPAIFPLTNAALGAAGAFTTMGVAVAGAMAIFGGAVVGNVMAVSKLNKEVEKAKKNLDTQREALNRLTPGTDAYATQLKKVEEAQLALNEAQAAYSPLQRDTANAMVAVKGAWADFVKSTEGSTLPIVTNFLLTAKDALPRLVPAVKAISPEFAAIGTSLRGWVNDGGLDRFVNFIINTGVPAFRNLRLAGANIATVMGNLFRAFSGGARDMSGSILSVTSAMAKWSNQGGFERFIAKVKQDSPMVREFFRSLWDAIKNIHDALAPLGPLGLGFVTILLKMVAALPPEWIRAIYLGFIAWRAALLGMLIIAKINALIGAMSLAWSYLSFVFAASPIGVIVVAIIALIGIIVLLWLKCDWFRNFWKSVWEGIKVAAVWVWENALKPAFNGIMTGLKFVGDAAVWLWKKAIKPAFDGIWFAARLLVVILGTVLFTPLYLAFKLLRTIVMALWNNAFKYVFQWIVAGAKLWWAGVKIYFNFVVGIIKTLASWGKWLWNNAFKPVFGWIVAGAKLWWAGVKVYFKFMWEGLQTIGKWGKWLWNNALKPAFNWIADGAKWLWNKAIKPVVGWITDGFKTLGKWAKWLWTNGIKPHWDKIKAGTNLLKDGMIKVFDKMKDGIGKVWTAIKKIAAVPINFVIDTVYNGGIVKVWNKIAGAVGLDKMKLGTVPKIKYAKGGAITGAATGHDGVPITAMAGEHIWTKEEVKNAGGHRAMAAMRSAFSRTGAARVAPGHESIADYSKGPGYAWGGGIIDWTTDKLGDAAGGLKDAWDATGGKVVSKAWDALKDVTRGAIGTVANPILKSIRSGVASGVGGVIPGKPQWESLAVGTATKPIDWLLDWINKDDAAHSGMVGGGNTAAALKWAKSQEGKPYVWGGVGPGGYDCSGFMSAIQNVIMGQSPYRRQWATGAFPPGAKGYKRNLKSPFEVGITNAGVGHTAGTLNGVNVESRGGRGVVIGKAARGAGDGMFTSRWGFQPALNTGGGSGRWAETATAVLRELGVYSTGNLANVLKAIQKESGGNPNAVNNWDSNAKAGNPSKGLLQVIKTTFDAYAGKYKSKGQLDPYANIYAAVRYARAAYGGGWSARMARPGGYKIGGPMVPGLSVVGEAGPELVASDGTHRVISASETQRLIKQHAGGGGGGMAVVPTSVTVKIGEREFLAMLDDETRATFAALIKEAEGSR
ncbi:tape measure protein [Streptomyces phage Marky]|nr:tape measure protein [Streptomyces phage Marky]